MRIPVAQHGVNGAMGYLPPPQERWANDLCLTGGCQSATAASKKYLSKWNFVLAVVL
jgi:hypothetical protein